MLVKNGLSVTSVWMTSLCGKTNILERWKLSSLSMALSVLAFSLGGDGAIGDNTAGNNSGSDRQEGVGGSIYLFF